MEIFTAEEKKELQTLRAKTSQMIKKLSGEISDIEARRAYGAITPTADDYDQLARAFIQYRNLTEDERDILARKLVSVTKKLEEYEKES